VKPKPDIPLALPPISAAAPAPLYAQIIDGITREISEGRLLPGQPLPSFRALAKQLVVSLITVKRAYAELERQGIIYPKQGLGTFVSEDGDVRNRQAKRDQAERLLRAALDQGAEAGLSDTELLSMTKQFVHERQGQRKGQSPKRKARAEGE